VGHLQQLQAHMSPTPFKLPPQMIPPFNFPMKQEMASMIRQQMQHAFTAAKNGHLAMTGRFAGPIILPGSTEAMPAVKQSKDEPIDEQKKAMDSPDDGVKRENTSSSIGRTSSMGGGFSRTSTFYSNSMELGQGKREPDLIQARPPQASQLSSC
jgi:hypothetical protein